MTGEQLHTLMDVRRPDTGQELRRAGGTGEAVAALDATFSAPKSVSAAWALAALELRERIEDAHETAIDGAPTYATRMVPMLRRRVSQDTVSHEKATGLVATSWLPTTARAVDGQAPDPQLHSHVLLHAAVRRDGRVVAIDYGPGWCINARSARHTDRARPRACRHRVCDRAGYGAGWAVFRDRRRPGRAVGQVVQSPSPGAGRDPRPAR